MKFALTVLALALFVSSVVAQETLMAEPKIIKIPQAAMPREAAESGLGGKVRVGVRIDEAGNVMSVESVSGPDSVCSTVTRADVVALREAARTAAMDAKYEPSSAGVAWLSFDFPRGSASARGDETYNAATVAEESGTEAQSPAPRDPNKFTVRGDVRFTADTAPPADHTGPVVNVDPNKATAKTDPTSIDKFKRSTFKADPTVAPKTLSGGVLNGKATSLVKPQYPAAARAVRASGAVSVQVLIDTEGKVWSAAAVSGHPLLRAASVGAACRAEFAPTFLSGQPVKISGIITYNFVP